MIVTTMTTSSPLLFEPKRIELLELNQLTLVRCQENTAHEARDA